MAPGSRFGRKSPLAHFGPAGKLFLAPAITTAHHNRSCRPTTAGGLVNRRFILATALLVPALAFVSCKDDGNSSPVEPQSNSPQGADQAVRGAINNIKLIKTTPHSEAALAAARKTDLADVSQSLVAGDAVHDPNTPLGVIVDCFDGV